MQRNWKSLKWKKKISQWNRPWADLDKKKIGKGVKSLLYIYSLCSRRQVKSINMLRDAEDKKWPKLNF